MAQGRRKKEDDEMAIVTRVSGESDADFLARARAANGTVKPIQGDPLRLPILYVPRSEEGYGEWLKANGLCLVGSRNIYDHDAMLAVASYEGQHPVEYGTAGGLVEGIDRRATTPRADSTPRLSVTRDDAHPIMMLEAGHVLGYASEAEARRLLRARADRDPIGDGALSAHDTRTDTSVRV